MGDTIDSWQQLHQLVFMLQRGIDQTLQEQLGIGYAQCKLLALLASDMMTQRALATTLGQTEASISRQVVVLQTKGLAVMQISGIDRRQHMIQLTTKGQRIYTHAMELYEQYHQAFFAGLSSKERDQFRATITGLYVAMAADRSA